MKKTIVVIGAGKGLGNGVAETFGSNDFYAPKTIAEEFWKLYTEKETSEIVH